MDVSIAMLEKIKNSSDIEKDLGKEVKNKLAIGYPPDPELEKNLKQHLKNHMTSS